MLIRSESYHWLVNHACFSDKKLIKTVVFLINLEDVENNFMQVFEQEKNLVVSLSEAITHLKKLKLCTHLRTEFN